MAEIWTNGVQKDCKIKFLIFSLFGFFCYFYPLFGQNGEILDKNGRNGPKNENIKNLILQSFCTPFVHISAKFGVSRSNIPGGEAILVVFLKSQLNFQSAGQSPYKARLFSRNPYIVKKKHLVAHIIPATGPNLKFPQ